MNIELKKAIIEKGVSQFTICLALGWDPSKFSKLVHGWKMPSPEERKALASFLGRDETELFADCVGQGN